jgi:hypothetical protein
MQHRTEAHARLEDWLQHLPPTGLRAMCDWERFCTFAREPERREVGIDARVVVEGVAYTVEPDLAGETVVLWWGLFDQELYVEHGERRYGPYHPVGGPIPLHRYRRFKKTATQQRVERLEALAAQLLLPRAAVEGGGAATCGPSRAPGPTVCRPRSLSAVDVSLAGRRQIGHCRLSRVTPGEIAPGAAHGDRPPPDPNTPEAGRPRV